jgi:hypothetical protein
MIVCGIDDPLTELAMAEHRIAGIQTSLRNRALEQQEGGHMPGDAGPPSRQLLTRRLGMKLSMTASHGPRYFTVALCHDINGLKLATKESL